jgi:holo-[acyl-carrier protein] synthase
MILGIGTDVVELNRFAEVFARHEARLIKRCFSPEEIDVAEARRSFGTHIAAYAKRFAAKEACAKALGTGFVSGIFLKDIVVMRDASGRPTLHLKNGAAKRLDALVPSGHEPRLHVTLTDSDTIAQAFVVIEGL